MEEGHDGEGDDEAEGVQDALGERDELVDAVLDQSGDGGLGDVAEQQGRHGDPELRPGQLQVEFSHGPDGHPGPGAALVRHGLELGAPAGDEGELHRHEEPVGEEQEYGETQVAGDHDKPPPPTARASRRSRTSATRWPSSSVTSSCQPSWSKPSPTSGILPRLASTKPAKVS